MYVKKMTLRNYRCFKSADIEFRKITLILGPNSGGKTAILSGLLSVLQTERFPLYLNPNGRLVETGDFKEISHRHAIRERVAIGVEYEVPATKEKEKEKESESRTIEVSGEFVYDAKTKM